MKYNQPFDQPSNPNAGYVDGNPGAGISGSIPPAASIEYPQREIVEVITDAGLAPSNSDLKQLAKGIQSSALMYGLDTSGSPGQITVATVPVFAAYAAGMSFNVKMANPPAPGANTINFNSIGNKPVVKSGGVSLNGQEWKTGDVVTFKFDGTNFQVWVPSGQLTANAAFFVNGTIGSDTLYDGTSPTVSGTHGPWATLQHAEDTVSQYALNGFTVTVHVASGTYAPIFLRSPNGIGQIQYVGDSTTPANCVIVATGPNAIEPTIPGSAPLTTSSCIVAYFCGQGHVFNGFELQAPYNSAGFLSYGVFAEGAGTVLQLLNIEWGTCISGHTLAWVGAQVGYSGNQIVAGNAPFHIQVQYGGFAGIQGNAAPALSIPSAVTFSGAFISADFQSGTGVTYSSITGAGNVTGQRYGVAHQSMINSNGGGASYYPGTVAGVADATSIYI